MPFIYVFIMKGESSKHSKVRTGDVSDSVLPVGEVDPRTELGLDASVTILLGTRIATSALCKATEVQLLLSMWQLSWNTYHGHGCDTKYSLQPRY